MSLQDMMNGKTSAQGHRLMAKKSTDLFGRAALALRGMDVSTVEGAQAGVRAVIEQFRDPPREWFKDSFAADIDDISTAEAVWDDLLASITGN